MLIIEEVDQGPGGLIYISDLAWSRHGIWSKQSFQSIAENRVVFRIFLGLLRPRPSWEERRISKWTGPRPGGNRAIPLRKFQNHVQLFRYNNKLQSFPPKNISWLRPWKWMNIRTKVFHCKFYAKEGEASMKVDSPLTVDFREN